MNKVAKKPVRTVMVAVTELPDGSLVLIDGNGVTRAVTSDGEDCIHALRALLRDRNIPDTEQPTADRVVFEDAVRSVAKAGGEVVEKKYPGLISKVGAAIRIGNSFRGQR